MNASTSPTPSPLPTSPSRTGPGSAVPPATIAGPALAPALDLTAWDAWIAGASGQLLDTPQGPEYVTDPGRPRLDLRTLATGGALCPLPDYGRLEIAGVEAAGFLHAQLTNDVASLVPGHARWTGYCSPKGRLLTTALNWFESSAQEGAATIVMAVSRASAEALRKRLSMFVLRAKAKVTDGSARWLAFGLIGPAVDRTLGAIGLTVPPGALDTSTNASGALAIRLPSIDVATGAGDADAAAVALQRAMLWLRRDDATAIAALAALTAAPVSTAAAASPVPPPSMGRPGQEPGETSFPSGGQVPIAPTALWRWTEVRAGVARIFPGSSEQFVPQMVNFELVEGVNFKKGCYPGQEVVARSQYLGKLRRRMSLARLESEGSDQPESPPAPGQDVVPVGGGEPAGMVVMAARHPDGPIELLFESPLAALQGAGLRVDERPLRLLNLPYAIPPVS